jgi:hypothetical protein
MISSIMMIRAGTIPWLSALRRGRALLQLQLLGLLLVVETIRPDEFLRALGLLLVGMLACGLPLEVAVVRRRICEVVKTFSFDVIHGFYDSDFDTGIDI